MSFFLPMMRITPSILSVGVLVGMVTFNLRATALVGEYLPEACSHPTYHAGDGFSIAQVPVVIGEALSASQQASLLNTEEGGKELAKTVLYVSALNQRYLVDHLFSFEEALRTLKPDWEFRAIVTAPGETPSVVKSYLPLFLRRNVWLGDWEHPVLGYPSSAYFVVIVDEDGIVESRSAQISPCSLSGHFERGGDE